MDDIQKMIERINSNINAKLAQDGYVGTVWEIGIQQQKDKPIEEWSIKDFVVYFKEAYFKVQKQDYIITYSVDNPEMQRLKSALVKAGMPKKYQLKAFLDWCVSNKESVLAKRPDFMLHDLIIFINNFAQSNRTDVVAPQVPDDADFVSRLAKKIEEGASLQQLLEAYGLPVVCSYLHFVAGREERTISANIEKTILKLVNDKKINSLIKIAKQSINMSPYPTEFLCVDWRNKYNIVWDKAKFKGEDWWRDVDYSSKIPKQYMQIVGE